MAELIKIDFIEMPKVLVIGRTLEVDWTHIHENNPVPAFWDDCFREGLFKKLEAMENFVYDPAYVIYTLSEIHSMYAHDIQVLLDIP